MMRPDRAVRLLPARAARLLIRIYRYAISPLIGPNCRHLPTCSEYAEEAVQRHGLLQGIRLAVMRLGRCHPWGSTGYDPVPECPSRSPEVFAPSSSGIRRPVPTLAYVLFGAALLSVMAAVASANQRHDSERHDFLVTTVVEGLDHPWAMAFLPNGDMLVTERPGRLRIVRDGELVPEPVGGLPDIAAQGQGGLMDIALHPEFESNELVYLSYAASGTGGQGTEVARGHFQDGRLADVEVVFRALPKERGGRHFGSRLVFDNEGYLYVTLGDRGRKATGQDLATHTGSIVRIHDDGSVPEDNPFVDGERPEIFSYGHRNVQGADLHPETGELWTHEHGPQGGDELNVVRSGRNYGWPVITYGVNYGSGTQIGEGTHKDGMEQPLWYWVPSIAPSGMTFYTGDRFPAWRDSVFVGALKFQLLARLELDGEKVLNEERMLDGRYGRIRAVNEGPDGYLYLLTDDSNGHLLRMEPVD